ncbi:copia protein [Tanacetum coccineum]
MVIAPKTVHNLNFGNLNDLPDLNWLMVFQVQNMENHLCSACERGKSKKASHPPKLVPSDHSKLELLHMDLCDPMRSTNHEYSIQEDLDNLFGPNLKNILRSIFEQPSIRIAPNQNRTQVHEDSSSTSSIFVDAHEAPPVVTTSDEQTSLISLTEAVEFNQEDSANFDGNAQFVPYNPPSHEEIESSTMTLEPLNFIHSPRGIFISQSQYAIELLKKHGLDECVSMSTPMATERLDADLQGTPTDQTTYHRMIGGLMYLTASRPDIAFATFVCARYQARPTVKHLKEDVKDDCKSTS